MKHWLILPLLVLLINVAPPANALEMVYCKSETHCDRDPKHLEAFVEEFYIWYIISVFENQTAWDQKPVKETLKITLSNKFRHDMQNIVDKTDADPILVAQDYDKEWLHPDIKIISVSKDTAFLKVTFYSSSAYIHMLKVQLKPLAGKWVIDEVMLTGDK